MSSLVSLCASSSPESGLGELGDGLDTAAVVIQQQPDGEQVRDLADVLRQRVQARFVVVGEERRPYRAADMTGSDGGCGDRLWPCFRV